jgi:hypothetical protein
MKKAHISLLIGLVLSLFLTPVVAQAGEAGLQRFVLQITDRQVQRDSDLIRVNRGQQVELVWMSDEAVTLHLHGYDIEFVIEPGMAVSHQFEAHASGRFPITSHGFGKDLHGHETLLYFEVYPE